MMFIGRIKGGDNLDKPTHDLKRKINELEINIKDGQSKLKQLINELQSVCTHDIAKVENIYDYDRSKYEITCTNCNKCLAYCSNYGFKKFNETYKGTLIGNVPNLK